MKISYVLGALALACATSFAAQGGATGVGTLPIPCRVFATSAPGLELLIKTPTGDTLMVSPGAWTNGPQGAANGPPIQWNSGGDVVSVTFHYSPNDGDLDAFIKRMNRQLAGLQRRYPPNSAPPSGG